MKLTSSLLALLASTAAPVIVIASPVFDTTIIDKHMAPLISSTGAAEHEIDDSYIVVFKKHVKEDHATQHHAWVSASHSKAMVSRNGQSVRGGNRGYAAAGGLMNGGVKASDVLTGLKHTFNIPGLMGYSGAFDESTLNEIRASPDVDYVEKDSKVYTRESHHGVIQKSAPWGLARISHRDTLSFGTFNKYLHSESGGEGVHVYVIDTGTNYEHVDFEGRAHWGKTIPSGDADEDGNGHGTHCSGTIAGKKYGVSKKAQVHAVKVLRSNGSGTMSDVVKGVEWAVEDFLRQEKKAKDDGKPYKGAVANMSLGGGKSTTLDMAVNAAVDAGMHFAVAAGNDNADACSYSPASAENAVTVGASTLGDDRAYFSNYGKCVDIFAPGLNIQSTWIGSKYAVNTISGTSMASPHIAGLLAYFLSLQPTDDSGFAVDPLKPAKLKKNMIAIASPGVLDDIPKDTCNLLAWNGGGNNNLTEIFHDKPKHKDASSAPSHFVEDSEALFEKVKEAVIDEVKALVREGVKHM